MSQPLRLQNTQTATRMIGIVHLGPGAFFRSHTASYTADAVKKHGGDWGICAVSLRSSTIRDALVPQGFAYTAITRGAAQTDHRVIDIISNVLVAPENPAQVLDQLSDPCVKIVSLTITEKGYCHDPASCALQLNDPDVQFDLANPKAPRTAIGFLVYGLVRRFATGQRPFTVISCDNLPDNGAITRAIVLQFAEKVDPALADWIAAEARFPSTMVDRITPATTPSDIEELAQSQGYTDLACVVREPFSQWVIEDSFVDNARPAWDSAGAQFVRDVGPFETMKLRCLNGTHSALAYLGYLAGHETISATVSDSPYAVFTQKLWKNEILPTVPQPDGEDLTAYCAALLERYRNTAIQHRTWQIAMDGSQKLPQRILGTIADNLDAGRDITGLALVVAAWMRYVGGVDEKGCAIDVRDPLASTLRAASDAGKTPAEKVENILAIQGVFTGRLTQDPTFCAAITQSYTGLIEIGSRAMVSQFTA